MVGGAVVFVWVVMGEWSPVAAFTSEASLKSWLAEPWAPKGPHRIYKLADDPWADDIPELITGEDL